MKHKKPIGPWQKLLITLLLIVCLALGCSQCDEGTDDAFFGDKDVEEEPFDDDDNDDETTDDDDNDDNDDTTGDDDDDDNDDNDDNNDDNDDQPVFEIIETGSFEYTSIALGQNSDVHVGCIDTTGSDFTYATNTNKGWNSEKVGATHQARSATSLKVDSAGGVHACFSSENGAGELLYAYNDGNVWTLYPVDSVQTLYCAIDLESSDALHMAYFDLDNNNIEYQGPGFVNETIASTQMSDSDGTLSLALDTGGSAHVVFADTTGNGALRYTNNSTGSWVEETLVNASVNSSFVQIDSNSKVHIVYSNVTAGQVLYMTDATGTWVAQVIKGSLDSQSGHVSLDMDAGDNAHISFYDGPQDALAYASNFSGTWTVSEFKRPRTAPFGTYTSIVSYDSGDVHIVFIGGAALRYANLPAGYSGD